MNDGANMLGLVPPDAVVAETQRTWAPPPKLTLSQWADENFYLSPESSATSGRWSTLPYQREVMDAITDPNVMFVTVMKSARVGFTKIFNAAIGYHVEHDPCPILVVQPTVDDAEGYSKEEIDPMLRDCPTLSRIFFEDVEELVGPRGAANTIRHKKFPGGVLSMVGANSGAGFRRISRRVVIFDEVDTYPSSAGGEGDPVRLGTKRSEYYFNRKLIHGSTPLFAGASRIEALFAGGDQRRYHVPCPHCGYADFLVFRERQDGRGHVMRWPKGAPEDAYFQCAKNGCVIEHSSKRTMVEQGRWVAEAPFTNHASFHVWAAYSYSPNATWADIAREFVAANKNPEDLKTFVNTVLGETWQEQGEAPDWERLYQRREKRQLGHVPEGVRFLTAGVDVQRDRWVYEVVGWGPGGESWSIDAGVILGETSLDSEWVKVTELLNRSWATATESGLRIARMAIDAGNQTQTVYRYVMGFPGGNVIAVKGASGPRPVIATPSKVDVDVHGRRIARGASVWIVGVDTVKAELYGWLRATAPVDGAPFPPGWCHFPEYGEDFFKQITAEHRVTVRNQRTGQTTLEWHVLPGRENHWLDARVYARAAAATLGVDRLERPVAQAVTNAAPVVIQPTQATVMTTSRARPSFIPRVMGGDSWLRRKR